ncbi:MAG: hypothetical protein GTO02_13180, partial [Candidatus Dadabacteria bacterium]|nr:hypothetical protein [Candidatus Dadabacteria bacterium]NIQ15300.1 hypothetical protein [Candidatus Dadabacteria bacterium]
MRFIKCLDWDSQFFGIKIGRINIDPIRLNLDTLKEALREAATCNIQCLYLEIGFSHPELLDYCSKENFSLVDCKTTLCKSLDSTENLENLKANNLSFEIKNEYNPGLEQIAEQIS